MPFPKLGDSVDLSNFPQVTLGFIVGLTVLTFYFHVRYSARSIIYGPTILTTSGIFATFFGIATGLANFNSLNVESSVPSLIDGLKTAFWGSVAGVGGALTIKFRLLIFGGPKSTGRDVDSQDVSVADLAQGLRDIEQCLVGDDESTIVSQLKLTRQDTNDRLDALRKAQLDALEKLSQLGSKALIEALRDVIRDFNAQLTEQFGQNFKQLNEAVAKLVTWQEQYKAQVEALTEIQLASANSMKEATSHYEILVTQSEVFVKVSADLSKLLTALEVQKQTLVAALKSLGGLLQAASGSLPAVEKKVMELTDHLTSAVGRNQAEVSKALSENALLIRNSIETAGRDIATLNSNISREISGFIAKSKDQITLLDEALSEELQKSLESLGRQLTSLSEKFVSDYSPLTEKLRLLVHSAGPRP